MELHQQHDPADGLTHAVPNDNPGGAALCGRIVHDQSNAAWRAVAYSAAWEGDAREARCPACVKLAGGSPTA